MSQRLIRGILINCGIFGTGLYIGHHSQNFKKFETEESKLVTLTDQVHTFLNEKNDHILWPKYNVQIQDDTTDSPYTLKLFKKFYDFGLPPNLGQLNVFSHYLSVTDSRLRIPLYVAWSIPHITKSHEIKSDRKYSKFIKSDTFEMISNFNADNEDYFSFNYSRGHLANCGDFTGFQQKAMNDTHLLANNIVPQSFANNAGYWLRMERYTRSLAERFNAVHVIAGPVLVPKINKNTTDTDEPNKKMPKGEVNYLIIGKNNVCVPTHLFRIIIAEQKLTDGTFKYFVQAFLVPNEEISPTDHLTKYTISLKELEKLTGLKFLYKIEQQILQLCCENNIDSQLCACKCDLPPWQDLIIQNLLWKKNITENEINEKWDSLIKDTNWTPSNDIIKRKNKKIQEINEAK